MHLCYGESFYNSVELKKFAHRFLEMLPPDVTTLVSRGSSGCAIASAMLMLSDKELRNIYIRKPEEHSHGSDIVPYPFPGADKVFCFVDDMISSGETLLSSIQALSSRFPYARVKYAIVNSANFPEEIYRRAERINVVLPKIYVDINPERWAKINSLAI